jgi:hypothetical protein
MKKILLSIIAGAVCLSSFGQNFASLNGTAKDYQVMQVQPHPDDVMNYPAGEAIGSKAYDNTIIGNSWYDLQSYTNVMPRMWVYPDGTIGAAWMSAGENLSPERGAGYNYFDGNAWGTYNPHVGPSDRMGWPNYAPWGPDGEIIALYKYVAGAGVMKFFKREVKGQGDWVEIELAPPVAGISLVWHSMMTSGENHEYIHLLAYTYDAEYNGQANALLYYRSSDGAETWEVEGEVIEGLGPDYFPTIHSLTYTWANPVGNTIAFTYGFDELGGWVFKSLDNGDTWEFSQVMETELDPFNIPTDSQKFPCGSGSSAIVLDSQGSAHVVFGRMAKIYTAGTQYFYPWTDGLIYWNESMPVIDTTLISTYTLDYLEAAGNLCGWVITEQTTVTIPEDQPNYNASMCSFPQLSIDAEDNIFLVSCQLSPDYTNAEFMYRHIVANSTYDLGSSWVGQIDLNADVQYIFSECAYPMMPLVIDDFVYIDFQEDPYPGINQWLTNHDPVQNNIMHMAIDKNVFVGVKENGKADEINFTLYPNPASSGMFLQLDLKKASPVSVKVMNTVGQTVMARELGTISQGVHRESFDVSGLSAGIYFAVVSTGDRQVTQKIVIK